jgi:spore coat polysaccharide biosynthesis protein SpsF (cytidylyltransferase family)
MFYILAVPDEDESEPMLEIADKLEVDNFCGSELNVLKRYYDAARFFRLDYIARITGDCPFIDPVVVSEVIQLLVWRKLDYASNIHPIRTYQRGLDCEAFTMDCLEACYKLSDQLSDYEHVTTWMQRTKELKTGLVKQAQDMSEKNWCVDYASDIPRLEEEIKIRQAPAPIGMEAKILVEVSVNDN